MFWISNAQRKMWEGAVAWWKISMRPGWVWVTSVRGEELTITSFLLLLCLSSMVTNFSSPIPTDLLLWKCYNFMTMIVIMIWNYYQNISKLFLYNKSNRYIKMWEFMKYLWVQYCKSRMTALSYVYMIIISCMNWYGLVIYVCVTIV